MKTPNVRLLRSTTVPLVSIHGSMNNNEFICRYRTPTSLSRRRLQSRRASSAVPHSKIFIERKSFLPSPPSSLTRASARESARSSMEPLAQPPSPRPPSRQGCPVVPLLRLAMTGERPILLIPPCRHRAHPARPQLCPSTPHIRQARQYTSTNFIENAEPKLQLGIDPVS